MTDSSESFDRRRYRRCFHRVISGIERGGQLRFLTLTSAPDSPVEIQHSWRRLYARFRRRGWMSGYIKVTERTHSGLLHLHVLYRGEYIPQPLISKWWAEIHGAPIVDIRRAFGRTGAASYLAKYMSKTGARYSWSWGWVYRGFAGVWAAGKALVRRLCRRGPDRSGQWWDGFIRLWRLHLRFGTAPDAFLGFLAGACDAWYNRLGIARCLR